MCENKNIQKSPEITSTNINNIELGKFYYNNNENTPDYDYDINSN